MPYFLEQECPVCHRSFQQYDDVVVCPECGAPYHRNCWKNIGQCAYSDKHGTSEQWQPKPCRDDDNIVICENCGTANEEDSKSCNKCGHSFDTSSTSLFSNSVSANSISGISNDDRAAFIGRNAEYYLSRFEQIEKQHNTLSWNWCAAFFPAEWFLYRKMYKAFFVVLFLVVFLMSPSVLIIVNNYLAMAGNTEAYQKFLASGQLPNVQVPAVLLLLADAGSTLLFFLRIVFALKSNSLYFSFVQKNIVKIRQECSDPLYYRYVLSKKGGTNLFGVIVCLVLLFLFFFIGSILLVLYIQ